MSSNPLGDEELPSSPEEEKELKRAEKLLKKSQSLNPKIRPKNKSQREKRIEYNAISRFLSEYLDAYAVIGFNTAGEEVIIMKYNNALEGRALSNLVDEFFTHHFESLTSYSPLSKRKEDDVDDDNDEDDD